MSDTATTTPDRVRVHFSLDRGLLDRLRRQARAEDRPQRAVLERALRHELQDAARPAEGRS
jgi:predicted transcriptional regulator